MIPLPALLFMAQCPLLPVVTHGAEGAAAHSGRPFPCSLRHGRAAATPSPTPSVRVTIVNATCVPAISFSATIPSKAAAANRTISYPVFRQGTWTSDEPFQSTEFVYVARTTNNLHVAERTMRFKTPSSQTLLLTGDLGRTRDAGRLPQIETSQPALAQSSAPNFQFHIYPEEVGCHDPCHYRIVNAMPSKVLTLRSLPEGKRPGRQLGILTPGNSLLLVKQPPCVEWLAEIDGQSYPISILQEGAAANCLIPFFLREGRPSFVRIFEDP